jgi:hypothetical protein
VLALAASNSRFGLLRKKIRKIGQGVGGALPKQMEETDCGAFLTTKKHILWQIHVCCAF